MGGRLRQWLAAGGLSVLCYSAQPATALLHRGADEFESLTKSHDLVLTSFCMPWYEPCQLLSAELQTASESLALWDVPVVEIDCNKTVEVCNSFNVISHPTVRLVRGSEYSRYRGKLKASSIVTHVLRQVLPVVTAVDERNYAILKSLDVPLLLAVLSPDDTTSSELFVSLGEQLKADFLLGTTHDSGLLGDGPLKGTKLPYLVVLNSLDETKPVYDGPFERAKMLAFAKKVSSPLIQRLSLSSFTEYMKAGIPLALIFAEEEDERLALAEQLKPTALALKGRVNFATVDARRLAFLAEPLGLRAGEFPAFVVQTPDESFPLEQGADITRAAVEKLIAGVIGGPTAHVEL